MKADEVRDGKAARPSQLIRSVRRTLEESLKCPQCANDHELLEPAFRRPDAIFSLAAADRSTRVDEDDDMCRLRLSGAPEKEPSCRYFLRAVLPIKLLDADDFTQWGLWVEVSEDDIYRIRELWNDPKQGDEPAFAGAIANRVPGYPSTVGLPVRVQLREPPLRAELAFADAADHPLAAEWRRGVTIRRVHEWLRLMGIEC